MRQGSRVALLELGQSSGAPVDPAPPRCAERAHFCLLKKSSQFRFGPPPRQGCVVA